MDLQLVRYIRNATEAQLADMALILIQRHPDEALELIAEVPIRGVDIKPADCPSLVNPIFISDAQLKELKHTYLDNSYGGTNKVGMVKQLRALFDIGLKEALDVANHLIVNNTFDRIGK
jgi:hypothetical protein